MKLRPLNCFTCNARIPKHWKTGGLCWLLETDEGLMLIDTGIGLADYQNPSGILKLFRIITRVKMDRNEAAVMQLSRMGYDPGDVKNIILTHMHFDHCGGLSDFPHAIVHVHQREYNAFLRGSGNWMETAYVKRHLAHQPEIRTYENKGATWFDLPAVRLPFDEEIWLVNLFGHTYGHCGIAFLSEDGWHFHVGDAGTIMLEDYVPEWFTRLILGPHQKRLQTFSKSHPEIKISSGHMWLDYFEK